MTEVIAPASAEVPPRITTPQQEAEILWVRASLTPWLLDLPKPEATRSESQVYFIEAGTGGPIKIGKAVNPEARLAILQVGSPSPLRLIGSIPGGISMERDLHVRFDTDRIRGEWFTPSESLLAYLDEVLA